MSPAKQRSGRAFRGLALVFVLSFLNLIGVLVTVAALGGVAPWTRWQFIGMFGVLEVASGLANVVSPDLWRLPVAQMQTSARTDVKLAASALLIPHWGGLARSLAGLVLLALAAWQVGIGLASVALVPLILVLAWSILAVSAVLARAGVARPDLDVVQLVVRRGTRENELPPISIGASVFQFSLSVATIPAVKLLPPSVLYQSDIGPSGEVMLVSIGVALALLALLHLSWRGRFQLRAAEEQQREAEEES